MVFQASLLKAKLTLVILLKHDSSNNQNAWLMAPFLFKPYFNKRYWELRFKSGPETINLSSLPFSFLTFNYLTLFKLTLPSSISAFFIQPRISFLLFLYLLDSYVSFTVLLRLYFQTIPAHSK